MSNQFIFPKPKSWDVFEDIVCDVFARKLNNRNFQRYGRRGQRQFGVDIVGVVDGSLVGIQCKHYPNGKITKTDIEDEVGKAESFNPQLDQFYFVTSADRDVEITSYVYALSQDRVSKKKFPLIIKFWDDVYDWLSEFPDILYKHFTKYFPQSELDKLSGLIAERCKSTVVWPTSQELLRDGIMMTLKGVNQIDPYKATLGITTFENVQFNGLVDLDISLSDCLSTNEGFLKASNILKDVKNLLQQPFYSKELYVHLQTRLPYAVLLGWTFRRVTGYELRIFSSDQVWATSELPLVFTHLQETPPMMMNMDSSELVFVLNINRDINNQVERYVSAWEEKPRAVVSSRYLTSSKIGPALALSMALEISQKIKSFKDNWNIRKIHLFGAVPAGLSALIGFNLNSICPISIYYMDNSDAEFRVGGTIKNDM
jgi:CBASS immunity sensor of nucleotide second messenger signals/restriction endonuclease